MSGLFVNHRITIAESELDESFIRSSGPGGQNVNKVSSAVQLRFNVLMSPSLTGWAREMLLRGGKLTRDGVLVITAQRFREQERNRADARARLVELVRAAAIPPKPRRATKVPKASKKKRLDGKKRRARIKQNRTKID
ncbi:MAG TPA: alternative ribosome rescue aminoacyl-tRNA hydrolase ArfB [Rhizomicrobium sp.]|nr:alternative ribosome rescue aminoacyl-tRNA hydrolase ArfB [Rhizomicrobium sp.]